MQQGGGGGVGLEWMHGPADIVTNIASSKMELIEGNQYGTGAPSVTGA